jgi:hypothetical protein
VSVSYSIRNGIFEIWSSVLSTEEPIRSWREPLYSVNGNRPDLKQPGLKHYNKYVVAESLYNSECFQNRCNQVDVDFLDILITNYTIRVRGAGFFLLYVISVPEINFFKHEIEEYAEDIKTYSIPMPFIIKQHNCVATLFHKNHTPFLQHSVALKTGYFYLTFKLWQTSPLIQLNRWELDNNAPKFLDAYELSTDFAGKPIRVIMNFEGFSIKGTGLLFWKTYANFYIDETTTPPKIVRAK